MRRKPRTVDDLKRDLDLIIADAELGDQPRLRGAVRKGVKDGTIERRDGKWAEVEYVTEIEVEWLGDRPKRRRK